MCYRCATNPSIQHHCGHVTAMLSPLSHHGVTFMLVIVSSLPLRCHLCCRIVAVLSLPLCCCGAFAVALSQFHRPHRSVTFVVAIVVSPSCLSRFHRCHCGVTFASVVVSSLQSRRCGAFTVTLSWFRHCHCSVAFIIALSPFCCCHRGVAFMSITVSSLPLQCCLHVGCGFIIAIAVSPSCWSWFRRCHCGVTFTSVTVLSLPLRCRLHCRIIAVSSLQLRRCGAFTVALLQFHHRHRGVTFIVASSQCCRHRFVVTVAVLSSRFCHHLVVLLLQSHRCVVVVVVVALLWSLLLRCGRCC